MKNSKQNGFAHLAIVVAVIIIAVVVGIGYLVLKNDNKNSQNSSTATNTSTNPTTTSKSDDEMAAKAAAKDHFALVYQKKTNEAYQSSCKGFKDDTSYAVFQTTLERGNFYTVDLSAIEYTLVDVRNNQAQLSGPVGPLMPTSNLKVALLKDNGQWCVYGYEVK